MIGTPHTFGYITFSIIGTTDKGMTSFLGNLPPLLSNDHGKPIYAMGIEGSANKVAVGLVKYVEETGEYEIVANPRKTYIAPAGEGFLPRETAWHHQVHINALVRSALAEAHITSADVDCICYTKVFFPTLSVPFLLY